ncbi:hypothetical protein FBBAL38_12605 [Flavobacteria bacterium BAL38]|uniref:hypothetical protein n=1 Tax=unclassified Flavobacterium TaxID=196869 RepID=UPI0000F38AFC|nr:MULTISPECIES: hypothetical protein [unclassified Flavobacterium]EAZ94625.1 hypothetical protein FBBAL38_12605 [Flavobacteria bacterium BAL38]MQP52363.1 hypothetical protein [Flavobacterium sp. LMO9]MQP62433.1 hypothetical protein [Flavobacterium sp. LMO6]
MILNKNIILVSVLFIFLSCNNKTKLEDKSVDKKIDSSLVLNSQNWYDSLVYDYINNSENELIKLALKDNVKVEWILDQIEKTDSKNYYIFNIGQSVSDIDGTNTRFSSNGWIYIDSISKIVYEYDLPNDSLIVWNKK